MMEKAKEKKTDDGKKVIYWLNQIPFIGPVTMEKMRKYAGNYHEIYNIEGIEWTKEGILKESEGKYFDQAKNNFEKAEEQYHSLGSRGIRFITILDREYPGRLKSLWNAPAGLFVKGRIPDDAIPSLAVIGSRNATRYGLEAARCFGRELAAAGVQIISGLAAGIDGAGHQGALEGEGMTYGILGCGMNICYPKENYPLYEKVAEKGGILSEFPLGEAPHARNFPIRNRIISGLSDAVLVVEAREKSGSLITAGLALDQGKDIFALPGRATDPGSKGCNQLIQAGAFLVSSPGEILEYFGIQFDKKLIIHKNNEKGLAKKEKMVYSVIDLQPTHLEDIVKISGIPLSECMMILLDLELKGFICHTGGNYYSRK